MALRLQMKLGVVAEQDRLPDSPDTARRRRAERRVRARTKGNLYLLVTSRVSRATRREATRLVAETIRSEYYYDESAGIRVCIEKAIAPRTSGSSHQPDRLGLSRPTATARSASAVAVVRGNELYVARSGPPRPT